MQLYLHISSGIFMEILFFLHKCIKYAKICLILRYLTVPGLSFER